MSDLTIALPEDLVEAVAQRVAAILADSATPHAAAAWLDVDAAARHLGYSDDIPRGRRRIYDLVSSRQITPHRDGRRLLFKPTDLDAYLEGRPQ